MPVEGLSLMIVTKSVFKTPAQGSGKNYPHTLMLLGEVRSCKDVTSEKSFIAMILLIFSILWVFSQWLNPAKSFKCKQ